MCKSKMATDAKSPTRRKPSQQFTSSPRRNSRSSRPPSPASHPLSYSSENPSIGDSTSTSKDHWYNSNNTFSASIAGSAASLASLRESLPETPIIYEISEIRSATNKFLASRYSASSSTPSWRCNLRGKDSLVFQRKVNIPTTTTTLRENLSLISKSHHVTIVKLLGASLSRDDIFLVYEFVPGVNLSDCLRNPNNPSFTVLSNWMSRMQVATDVANGLDYIHNSTGSKLVHNHINSKSIIISDPSLNARICHFGTSILCGEDTEAEVKTEIESELKRSKSDKFKGTMGYMSPEFQSSGVGTQRSDVYAFGVVILELVSGEEAVKYKFDKERKEFAKKSVVEAAQEAVEEEGRVRRWVDRRLKDSFPLEVVERLTRLALECVEVEEDQRPNMRRVAGKVSKMYLESKNWADKIQPPTDFTVSYGPR